MVYISKMIWWISFSEIYPVSGFFRIFFKSSYLSESLWYSKITNIYMKVFFPEFSGFWIFRWFSGFSSDIDKFCFWFQNFLSFLSCTEIYSFSGFLKNLHIVQIVYVWYITQMLYESFHLQKLSGFRIFSDFL